MNPKIHLSSVPQIRAFFLPKVLVPFVELEQRMNPQVYLNSGSMAQVYLNSGSMARIKNLVRYMYKSEFKQ